MSKTYLPLTIPAVSALALAAAFTVAAPRDARACAVEPFIGSVCFMGTQYCPQYYLPANGQLLPVQEYQALFALLGVTYGGDGRTTFGVPDLRGRSPAGVTNSTTSGGTSISSLTYGQLRGQETNALTVANLAPHTHTATFTGTGGGGGGPATANGTVTLPVTGSAPSQAFSVSGSVKIANGTAAGGQTPSDGSVLTKAGGGQGAVYATPGTAANLSIGPSQTFSGTLPAATVTGSASGTVSLPVTGGVGGITGGTVSIDPTPPLNQGSQPFTNLPPQIGLSACIAWNGLWPSRP